MKKEHLFFGYIIFIACLLLQAKDVFALDPTKAISQYGYDVWNAQKGLLPYEIDAITQTRDGYIWLGTNEGVIRFDGVHFTSFNKYNNTVIRENSISALVEDKEGHLWIGTRGGGLVCYSSGVFTEYDTVQGLISNYVTGLFLTKAGALIIGMRSTVVQKYEKGKFSILGTLEPTYTTVQSFFEDNDGTIWVGGSNIGRIKPQATFLEQITPPRNQTRAIGRDAQGTLWIGKAPGVQYLRGDSILDYSGFDGLANSMLLRSILLDRDKNLWFGTEGNGVYRLTNGKFSHFTTEDGLADNRVLAMYEDKEGNIWLGTRGGGLNRLKNLNITTITQHDGLANEYTTAIFGDSQGRLWLGTRGGLFLFKDGQFLCSFDTSDGLSNNFVRSLGEDAEGNIWVGTPSRLNCIEWRGTTARPHITQYGEKSYHIRATLNDSGGNMLIGMYGPGVMKFSHKIFSLADFPTGMEANNFVRVLLRDRSGRLWAGSQYGINRYTGKGWKNYSVKEGLNNTEIFCIIEDENANLWLGTYGGGLNRFRNGAFKAVTTKDGLFDDVVFSLLDDGQGNYWMSCNKGIFYASKKELNDFCDGKISSITSKSLGIIDGMKSTECNGGSSPSSWRDKEGKLYFPTVKGVVIIDPLHIVRNTIIPSVVIEKIIINDSSYILPANVTFSPSERTFELYYTALSFVVPERVFFRYKLEGFDDNWIEAGTQRKANYTHLPPGKYVFRVQACNNDGLWNEQGAAFSFTLRPYAWETWWFRTIGIVVILFAVAFMAQKRERRKLGREREKNEIQKQLTELESRALRSQMNPHFIFNSLNAIQECILSDNTEAACEYLSKFAKLLRAILDHAEKPYVSLEQEIEALRLYCELESLRFDTEFSFLLDVDARIDAFATEIPAMLIQPYVENSIWHGLLPKKDNRKLLVVVTKQEDTLLFVVEDNGIGRARSSGKRNALKQDYESKGMRITRERLDAMNKMKNSNAAVTVVDLFDEANEPSGTRVEITIPVQ